MTILLDTDVLVDCLRGTAAAQAWLASAAAAHFSVPGIVAMELVVGSRNKIELEQTRRFLENFEVLWPEASEFNRAYELLAAYRLSSALSIPDCLIAAMALSRSAQLYTFNLKHFNVIAGLHLSQPYSRS